MGKKFLLVLCSIVLLSVGWLHISGLTLLAALVPLLLISRSYDSSAQSFFRMAGWTALTFAVWSIVTVWWIWNAAPIGAIAAVLIQTVLFGAVFMLYHYTSKRCRPALANVILVCGWLAAEYIYLIGEISFPWLLLGNGLANDIWAIQWYEYTGILGGSLWILVSNILIFYALSSRERKWWIREALWIAVLLTISVGLYWSWANPQGKEVTVTTIQPNINPYNEKFDMPRQTQDSIMLSLAYSSPENVDFLLLPETAVDDKIWEDKPDRSLSVLKMRSFIRNARPQAQLIIGATTNKRYRDESEKTSTARYSEQGSWYDIYNTALAIDSSSFIATHHKAKLVIGVEKMPYMNLLKPLSKAIIDLGGTTGGLGTDTLYSIFTLRRDVEEIRSAAPICYESVYGSHFAAFTQRGAQVMFVITNDGWWGDTPGYRQHFSFSRLRAIETRRWVVRSANTGISGFISPRGEAGETLGWNKRGIVTQTITLSDKVTLYTRYGDVIGRIGVYTLLLSLLYYVVYRFRLKSHLIDE